MPHKKICARLTVSSILVLHIQFTQSEITQGNVTSIIQQNVLWLQVPVDHLEAMQTFKRTEQFGGVEASSVDVKALFFLEMVEQLATIDKCKDKI